MIGDTRMRSEAWRRWVIAWMLVFLSVGVTRARETHASPPIINLYRGEINGVRVADISLATLPALLEDATAADETTGPAEALGVPRHYPALGLSFWFALPASDVLQRCWIVVVYLTPREAGQGTPAVRPFHGRISQQMNATWRLPQVQTAFRAFTPEFPAGAAWHEDAPALAAVLQIPLGHTHVVSITLPDYRLYFVHDPTTEVLERVLLVTPRR